MNKFTFWQRWLFFAGLLTVVFGLGMALLNGTIVFEAFNRQIDPVFWGTEGPPRAASTFQQWVYGAWGATVAGLGVLVVFIAHYPFRRREIWSRVSLVSGLAVWYVLDTGISLCFRVYFNAVFNSLLVVVLLLPLGLTWGAFSGETGAEDAA